MGRTGWFQFKEWAVTSHLAMGLMSISLLPRGSRSLREFDVGPFPYSKAQRGCVGNNSIKSKRTAGLRSKTNQPKTCQ